MSQKIIPLLQKPMCIVEQGITTLPTFMTFHGHSVFKILLCYGTIKVAKTIRLLVFIFIT